MGTYSEIGEAINGEKIITEARKIYDMRVIAKSRRCKAYRIVLKDDVVCYIDKRIRSLK